MFRKTSLLVAAVALLAAVPQAQAAKGDWKFALLGGVTMPTGDFSQKLQDNGLGADLGFGAGVGVTYMMSEQFGLGVDGFFANNGLNSDELDLVHAIDPSADLKYKQFGGGAHLKYWLPMGEGPVDVYLVGGAGVSHFKAEISSSGIAVSTAEDQFAGYGGVGLGYQVAPNVSLGIQTDMTFVTLTDLTASSVGVKGALTFGLRAASPK